MSPHIPRKRFGQHFLHDRRVINRIIDSLSINNSDIWLEIGPGQGALTRQLPSGIRHLYLVEIDTDLAKALESEFAQRGNITVVNQDILNLDFTNYLKEGQGLRILGNLPYNISTPIFFHLAQFAHCIDDMTFMVQKEVADRLTAEAGSKAYGRLSLSAGLRFSIRKFFDVGPGAFNPPPKVKSSIIRLAPRQLQSNAKLLNDFDMIVRLAFSKRRKTLRNSLGKIIDADSFENAGIDSGLRPESLTIDDFLKLAERVI